MIHSATVIASQLNIFDIVEDETTIEELATKTGADELLLREYSATPFLRHWFTNLLASSHYARSCIGRHLHAAPSKLLRRHKVLPQIARTSSSQLGNRVLAIHEQDVHRPA